MTKKQVLRAIERAYQKGVHDYQDFIKDPDKTISPLASAGIIAERMFREYCQPKTKALGPPVDPVFTACVDFWLKEFHVGWTFGGMQGKALKSIISKMRLSSKDAADLYIIESFKQICRALPAWFQDKDLNIIDSKFNEIMTQIINGKPTGQWNQQNSASRVFGKYSNL